MRGHCHGTGKFRGASHWNCNISLQSFCNISQFERLRQFKKFFFELGKFDVKTSVLPNGLKRHMAFF